MTATIKRPPSQRNFQVHHFLQEGGSTREAAAQFGISQTRVRQLERQVLKWAAEVLPLDSDAEVAGLVRVAESVAVDRLDYFYQQTMAQWHATHQVKFLGLAIRVTQASARLPSRSCEIDAAAADLLEGPEGESDQESSAGSQELTTEQTRPMVAALASPPAAACSEKMESRDGGRLQGSAGRIATPPRPSKLERLLASEIRPSEEQSLRLRTLLSPPTNATAGSLGMTAADLDLSVDDVLQCQQRKGRKAK